MTGRPVQLLTAAASRLRRAYCLSLPHPRLLLRLRHGYAAPVATIGAGRLQLLVRGARELCGAVQPVRWLWSLRLRAAEVCREPGPGLQAPVIGDAEPRRPMTPAIAAPIRTTADGGLRWHRRHWHHRGHGYRGIRLSAIAGYGYRWLGLSRRLALSRSSVIVGGIGYRGGPRYRGGLIVPWRLGGASRRVGWNAAVAPASAWVAVSCTACGSRDGASALGAAASKKLPLTARSLSRT